MGNVLGLVGWVGVMTGKTVGGREMRDELSEEENFNRLHLL